MVFSTLIRVFGMIEKVEQYHVRCDVCGKGAGLRTTADQASAEAIRLGYCWSEPEASSVRIWVCPKCIKKGNLPAGWKEATDGTQG